MQHYAVLVPPFLGWAVTNIDDMGHCRCSLHLTSLYVNAFGHKAKAANMGLRQLDESRSRASFLTVGMKRAVSPLPFLSHKGLAEIFNNGLRSWGDWRHGFPTARRHEQYDKQPTCAVKAHFRLRHAQPNWDTCHPAAKRSCRDTYLARQRPRTLSKRGRQDRDSSPHLRAGRKRSTAG